MTQDIHGLVRRLALRRPLFHSEADFQHALAWQWHLEDSDSEIRLETRPERGIRLDLLVLTPQRRTAVELKYLVARFEGTVAGEPYDLPNQGAHDISRHDVCKDLARVEKLLADGYCDDGWVIVLSNDPGYWRPGTKPSPIDEAFRLHEGRIIQGPLAWSPIAGAGTTRNRDVPLALVGSHTCAWQPYSIVQRHDGRACELRYLAFPIAPIPQG